jgi:dipeptidase E
MGKIIAIGGGEIGDSDTLLIDRKIVRLAKRNKPKVLFIPTASNDAKGYCDVFRRIYGDKLKCQVDFLLLIKERDILNKKAISDKILSADIVYVGGGNTLKMLQIWRKTGVDKLLKKAYKNGVILTGLSAGAVCWFRYGVSDAINNPKDKKLFGRIRGLDMIPIKKSITFSPHNIREKTIRKQSIMEIMLRTPGICLAVDDNAALFIQDEIDLNTKKQVQKYEVWKSKENVSIVKYFKKNKKIRREVLSESGVLNDL